MIEKSLHLSFAGCHIHLHLEDFIQVMLALMTVFQTMIFIAFLDHGINHGAV